MKQTGLAFLLVFLLVFSGCSNRNESDRNNEPSSEPRGNASFEEPRATPGPAPKDTTEPEPEEEQEQTQGLSPDEFVRHIFEVAAEASDDSGFSAESQNAQVTMTPDNARDYLVEYDGGILHLYTAPTGQVKMLFGALEHGRMATFLSAAIVATVDSDATVGFALAAMEEILLSDSSTYVLNDAILQLQVEGNCILLTCANGEELSNDPFYKERMLDNRDVLMYTVSAGRGSEAESPPTSSRSGASSAPASQAQNQQSTQQAPATSTGGGNAPQGANSQQAQNTQPEASTGGAGNAENFNTYSDTEAPTGAQYVGNSSTMKFHKTSCAHVRRISPENVVSISNRDDAIGAGYDPCGTCKP